MDNKLVNVVFEPTAALHDCLGGLQATHQLAYTSYLPCNSPKRSRITRRREAEEGQTKNNEKSVHDSKTKKQNTQRKAKKEMKKKQ